MIEALVGFLVGMLAGILVGVISMSVICYRIVGGMVSIGRNIRNQQENEKRLTRYAEFIREQEPRGDDTTPN